MNRQTRQIGSIIFVEDGHIRISRFYFSYSMLGVGVRSCLLLSPTDSWHGDKGALENRFLQTQDEITISQAIQSPALSLEGVWADSHVFNILKAQREGIMAKLI